MRQLIEQMTNAISGVLKAHRVTVSRGLPDTHAEANRIRDQIIYAVADAEKAIEAAREYLAQPEQSEPYDKTELNSFVQAMYDQKMREGKHGHYETMFHVVHQAIKRVAPQPKAPEQSDAEVVELQVRLATAIQHRDGFRRQLEELRHEMDELETQYSDLERTKAPEPLTDDEINSVAMSSSSMNYREFARAVLAAQRSKAV